MLFRVHLVAGDTRGKIIQKQIRIAADERGVSGNTYAPADQFARHQQSRHSVCNQEARWTRRYPYKGVQFPPYAGGGSIVFRHLRMRSGTSAEGLEKTPLALKIARASQTPAQKDHPLMPR